jgi:membrane protein DedA with SNARE-associated domain
MIKIENAVNCNITDGDIVVGCKQNNTKKKYGRFSKLINRTGQQLHKFISNGGWITILVIAFLGIFCAVVGHYGTMGFNWKWFLFFELPLYAFCGWALHKVFKLIKNNPDTFKY